MQKPTAQQRGQERAVLYPLIADTLIVLVMSAVALATDSLTLLGESIRIAIILLAGYWSVWCLMGVHRAKFTSYEFGTCKLECFANALCGLCLLVGGLFLCGQTVNAALTGHQAGGPAALAMAAVINAVNVLINAVGLIAMVRSSAPRASEAFRAQLKVRQLLLTASLAVQVALTAAALAKDPLFATGFDLFGAAIVTVLMLGRGLKMIADALPALLDAAAPPSVHDAVRAILGRELPDLHIIDVRTRVANNRHLAEVWVQGASNVSVEHVAKAASAAQRELHREGRNIDVMLFPVHERADLNAHAGTRTGETFAGNEPRATRTPSQAVVLQHRSRPATAGVWI